MPAFPGRERRLRSAPGRFVVVDRGSGRFHGRRTTGAEWATFGRVKGRAENTGSKRVSRDHEPGWAREVEPSTGVRPTVIFLAGSTACGKTDLAIDLAARLPLDLISVDSGQVYRELNIGTAKPSANLLEKFPHGLIDIRRLDQPFSAAEFCQEAHKLIGQSFGRGRTPLLVGGTMFYFSALLNGLSNLPPADARLRAKFQQRAARQGWPALHHWLEEMDPVAASRINPVDAQRISRALEINLLSGAPVSAGRPGRGLGERGVRVVQACLSIPHRECLHRRITRRLEQMLNAGLIDEVTQIRDAYPGASVFPSLRSVGYRQIWEYLDGKTDYSCMLDRVQSATRRLAKRQLTWLRNQPGNVWFDATDPRLNVGITQFLNACGAING